MEIRDEHRKKQRFCADMMFQEASRANATMGESTFRATNKLMRDDLVRV